MSILIGFTCTLLAGFLWTVPSSRRQPNRFFAAFLFLTAIELTIWFWGGLENKPEWVSGIWFALGKLQMPAFFFFFISSCYSDFRLKLYDSLHLIPFICAILIGILNLPFLSVLPTPITNAFLPDTAASAVLSHIIYYGYLTVIIVVLLQFSRRFRDHYSGSRSELLSWLVKLAGVSLFAHTLVMLRDILVLTSAGHIVWVLQITSALLVLVIITWIALNSLLRPELFRDVDRRLMNVEGQSSAVRKQELNRIQVFVENEKPYLNPDLNLAQLSHELAMTPRELSENINGLLGLHFFDFINQYRVEHAKMLLRNHPKKSVTQILYDSGFNSKSSFNTAFKKHTQLTPSSFRSQAKT